MEKVFLGGTCNESGWRDELVPLLKIDYFDPVVDDWTEEDAKEEVKQREICDYCLYVITPKMEGVYSIAEVVDDSNKRPDKTVFCVLSVDDGEVFSAPQTKSLEKVKEMVEENGAQAFYSLQDTASYLNS